MKRIEGLLIAAAATMLMSFYNIHAGEPGSSQPVILALEDCIKNALANNPKVIQAFSKVNVSKAVLSQARSDYLPALNTTVGVTHNESSKVSIAVGVLAKKSDTTSEQTGIEQLLWDFGRTLNQMRKARENLTFEEYTLLETQEDTILNVKIAYYKVLQIQLAVDVAKENLAQANVHLSQAQGFYDVGLKQKYEITRAQVDVSNAGVALVAAKKNHGLTKTSLNIIMGKVGNTDYLVQEITEVEFGQENFDDALRIAMENRVEVLKSQSNVRATQMDLEINKKGNWPRVSVSAGQAASETNVKGIGAVNSWNTGVAVKWPWFDGLRSSSKVKQAEENLKIAKSNAEELTFNIAWEVQDAVFGLLEAKERIQFTDKTLQLAQENFEITEARFKEGLNSAIELDDARILLFSAKNNRIAALSDYLIALAKYERSTGLFNSGDTSLISKNVNKLMK